MWSVDRQKRYEKSVQESHTYSRKQTHKLSGDANLGLIVTTGQYFLIQSAIAEAYRAGAMDVIFEDSYLI